jgi:hypothetical protein
VNYRLVVHPELRQEVNRLYEAWKQDPSSDAGREFTAFREAMTALRDGREGDQQYRGSKQLGYGPSSHDLRDTAELKVPVFNQGGTPEFPRQSHRMVYREFDPPMTMQDGRAAPDGPPIRQILAFNHRRDEPAAIAGERLGRQRGIAQGELHGLTGGGRPSVGRQREGVQITPHRMPVPNDVLQQILRDSPPAGSGPRPSAAPQARVNRPEGPGEGRERG